MLSKNLIFMEVKPGVWGGNRTRTWATCIYLLVPALGLSVPRLDTHSVTTFIH